MRITILAARLLGVGVVLAFPVAAAAQGCAGTYAATALHALAHPVVVGLDVRDATPEHEVLAQRFLQGARDGGVKTEGAVTTMIGINYSVLRAETGPSWGRSDLLSSDHFGGLREGIDPPPVPAVFNGRMLRQREQMPQRQPVTLTLRAEATRPGAAQVLWVMSLQCQVQTADAAVIAYELGRVVGQAVGRTVPRQAF